MLEKGNWSSFLDLSRSQVENFKVITIFCDDSELFKAKALNFSNLGECSVSIIIHMVWCWCEQQTFSRKGQYASGLQGVLNPI
jgi:hypothetical protein